MISTLVRNRRFIALGALHTLRARYAGSMMGIVWNVAVPLVQIVVFALVFGLLMKWRMKPMPGVDDRFGFTVFLCSALLAWNGFAETLSRSTASIMGNRNVLKKIRTREEIFVAQEAMAGALSTMITFSLFLLFCVGIAGMKPSWSWLEIIPLIVLFHAFAFGMGLGLGVLNVFFRDVAPLLGVTLMTWMWLTPVIYDISMIAHEHPIAGTLMMLNPAYYFTQGFREAIYGAPVLDAAGAVIGIRRGAALWCWEGAIGFSSAAIIGGWAIAARLRTSVRDVL
ncbi:MAG: ABC transporter permease [Phycisphaeraceae bacterium]|nr:MAG: ABC transporter permease [Phycisphaeraceae bacterium]